MIVEDAPTAPSPRSGRKPAAPARWREVGEAIRLRRLELGLRQTDTEGVSASSWRNLEGAKQQSYKPFLLRNVERVLGWPSGTIDDLLQGGEPPTGDAVTEAPPDLRDRLRALEARFERIEEALGRLEVGDDPHGRSERR